MLFIKLSFFLTKFPFDSAPSFPLTSLSLISSILNFKIHYFQHLYLHSLTIIFCFLFSFPSQSFYSILQVFFPFYLCPFPRSFFPSDSIPISPIFTHLSLLIHLLSCIFLLFTISQSLIQPTYTHFLRSSSSFIFLILHTGLHSIFPISDDVMSTSCFFPRAKYCFLIFFFFFFFASNWLTIQVFIVDELNGQKSLFFPPQKGRRGGREKRSVVLALQVFFFFIKLRVTFS